MSQTPAVFVQEGDSVDYTPGSDTPAGTFVVEGSRVGITKIPIVANRLGALALRGIFRAPKDASNITTKGANLYWDADGTPVGGTAGSGALATTATNNTYAGKSEEIADGTAESVLLRLGSMDQTATIDADHLSDVGTVNHAAGGILAGDGAKFEEVVVSGDATLAATGAMTLNAAHQEQVVLVPIAALGGGADLASTIQFAHPRAGTLVSVGYLAAGTDFGVIDNANTSVFAITDGAGNSICSKTFNTATQPTASALNDLGALDAANKALNAAETVSLAITNGATAKTPAGFLVLRFIPTNAA
jgi:predicted RecA/RadA family phage recombinase